MTTVNLFLILGLVAGLSTASQFSKRPDRTRLLWILGCWTGLLGARLAAGWTQTELLTGGLSSLGLGAGFVAGALACGWLLYPAKCLPRLMDDLVPGLAVALMVGRVGCWFEGCHAGSVTAVPWAATYGASSVVFAGQVSARQIDWLQSESLPVHPLPLYEAGAALLGIVVWFLFRTWIRQRLPAGLLLPCTIASYAALRVALEMGLGSLGIIPPGWLVLGLVALSISLWIWSVNSGWRTSPRLNRTRILKDIANTD